MQGLAGTVRIDYVARLGSVYDVIRHVTGCRQDNLSTVFSRMCNQFPDIRTKCVHRKFPGKGQKSTPCMAIRDLDAFATMMVARKGLMSTRCKMGSKGVVYVATSPLLSACKVGMWRGPLESLKSRYTTCYGSNVSIATYAVDDARAVEKAVHNLLESHRISRELFDLESVDIVKTFFSSAPPSPCQLGCEPT